MKTHSKMFAFQCLRCHKRFSDETTWDLHEERCISNVVCTKTIPLVNFAWLNKAKTDWGEAPLFKRSKTAQLHF